MNDQPPPTSPPPQPSQGRLRDPGGPVGRAISWAIIIALVAMLALTPMLIEPPAPEAGAESDAAPTAAATEQVTPAGIFGDALKPIVLSDAAAAKTEIGLAGGMFVRGPADRIRIAIVAGDAIGPDAAREQLDKLDPEELSAPFAADVDALRALYDAGSPDALSTQQADRLRDRYEWFGELALAYGLDDAAPPRKELLSSARAVHIIVVLFNFAIVLAFVVGVGLFITAIVLLATGRIRRAYAPPGPGGSVYLETFAAFLVGFLVISFIAEKLEPSIGSWSHLVRWAILPVAAWPLLRGAPWRNVKFAIGWHPGKGFVREAILGAVGYIALLPIVGIGVLCTLGLMALWGAVQAWFGAGEEGGVPTHPIGDLLPGASPIDLALLVMLGVIWAPVVEETFFRGALYHHLRGGMRLLGSGLVTGFIFAAIHPQGIFAIPALMSIGFVLCLLREWRGTAIAPMAAHALNNGFIFTMLILVLSA
ncbi:MAG: CPBP family intramembrane glutamic endopeptidase [Phycisphaerales bacterium JB039]